MKLLHPLRELAESTTGWYIRRRAPWGTCMFQDMATLLHPGKVRMVLDVGANVGQSAREYLSRFPLARIHSFEPVPSTFRKLRSGVNNPRITTYNIALGSKAGKVSMHVPDGDGASDLSSIGRPHPFMEPGTFHTEMVAMTTLDDWTAEHTVEQVDLLKVDTEGHDLEVLKGADRLLDEQGIRFITVEAGVDTGNTMHVPLADLVGHLGAKGYQPFGFYDQYVRAPLVRPVVRRMNVVFTPCPYH